LLRARGERERMTASGRRRLSVEPADLDAGVVGGQDRPVVLARAGAPHRADLAHADAVAPPATGRDDLLQPVPPDRAPARRRTWSCSGSRPAGVRKIQRIRSPPTWKVPLEVVIRIRRTRSDGVRSSTCISWISPMVRRPAGSESARVRFRMPVISCAVQRCVQVKRLEVRSNASPVRGSRSTTETR
jgi:hypothetical protein